MKSPIFFSLLAYTLITFTSCSSTQNSSARLADGSFGKKVKKGYSGADRPDSELVYFASAHNFLEIREINDKPIINLIANVADREFKIPSGHTTVKVKYYSVNAGTTHTTTQKSDIIPLDFEAELGKKYRAMFKISGRQFITWVEEFSDPNAPVIVSSNLRKAEAVPPPLSESVE